MDKIIGKIVLEDYSLRALTDSEDAQNGLLSRSANGSEVVTGRGVSLTLWRRPSRRASTALTSILTTNSAGGTLLWV
ncbi:MAG: hypothetical protein ACLUDF_05135 [Butyricicoccus sp.]